MNILFVSGMFAGNENDMALSGMPNAVFKSAMGMQKRGHKVRVLTVDSQDRHWYYRGLEVISVKARHGLEEKNVVNSLFCIIKREYKIEKTIRALHKQDPIDIIQYTGWFGIGLFHFTNIPSIMRISSYTKLQLINNYSKAEVYFFSTVERLAARRMNFIFAPSGIMAKGMAKDVGRKVGIIETPYFSEQLDLDDSVFQARLKNKRYILFFGRMSVDKGILVIRDILYRTLKEHPDVYFAFAGISWKHKGLMIEKELMRAAQNFRDRVIFLGMLPQNKLMPIVCNAEMILMPSLADNFPNACAEAMAMGKIVIGTDGSSIEQFIEDGINGYLTTIGDAGSLYGCVEYVLNMEGIQKKIICENARKRIRKLNLEQYSMKMEMLYNKVICNEKNILKRRKG